MTKLEYIRTAVDTSKLTREELASLFRISRNSLCRWLQGCPIRNEVSLDYAYFRAQQIIRAVACGKLPVPKGTIDRADQIYNALK
jgi:hypothetical protein